MRRSTLILFQLLLMLTACTNQTQDKPTAATKAPANSPAPSTADIENFFDNPFRDINNFSAKIDNPFLDSLNELFAHNPQVQTTTKNDLCGGDCCASSKIMTDSNKKAILYFFKSDCGEYGISNDQFFMANGKLAVVRNYSLGIEEWPTDTNETIWGIEEKIYLFDDTTATMKERKKLFTGLKDFKFTLDHIPFTISKIDLEKANKTQMDELKNLLANEDTESD